MPAPPPPQDAARPPGGKDPRREVTPYAFEVADRLMGVPLATPWRRAAAMLVDLAFVGALALLRVVTGPLFLLLLAWFAYRATTDRSRHPVRRTLPRLALRAVAVVLLLTGAAQGIGRITGGGDSRPPSPPGADAGDRTSMESAVAREGADVGFRDLLRSVGWVPDLRSGDTARARAAAEEMARRMADAGMTRTEIRRTLLSAGAPSPDSALRAATERAVAGLDSVPAGEGATAEAEGGRRARSDSLARAWAAALEAGDSAAAASSRRRMTGLLAADSVEALERRTSALVAALERMEDRVEEARDPPGLRDYLTGLGEDLGLGIGWFGLYFTAFLALWKGRTPGKRLLGVRVVKVNGEPMGWWDAFSRVGGYAASFVTGLLGFLQIAWDANRQGLHDRIAGTVVIRGEPPPPGDADVPGGGDAPARTRDPGAPAGLEGRDEG